MQTERKFFIRSGKGGDGHVSFRRGIVCSQRRFGRRRRRPGGDVIFEVDKGRLPLEITAINANIKPRTARRGGKRRCHGADGEDIVLKVPEGTVIMEAESRRVIADMSGEICARSS